MYDRKFKPSNFHFNFVSDTSAELWHSTPVKKVSDIPH